MAVNAHTQVWQQWTSKLNDYLYSVYIYWNIITLPKINFVVERYKNPAEINVDVFWDEKDKDEKTMKLS